MITKTQKAENKKRRDRAREIVLEYRRRHDPDEPIETAIVDLLADLKHMVAKLAGARDPNGFLKWIRLTDSAHRHFIAEVYGE